MNAITRTFSKATVLVCLFILALTSSAMIPLQGGVWSLILLSCCVVALVLLPNVMFKPDQRSLIVFAALALAFSFLFGARLTVDMLAVSIAFLAFTLVKAKEVPEVSIW